MKAKVLVKFKDKETGEIRNIGDVFVCNKKRFAEILEVGNYVEEVTEAKEEN